MAFEKNTPAWLLAFAIHLSKCFQNIRSPVSRQTTPHFITFSKNKKKFGRRLSHKNAKHFCAISVFSFIRKHDFKATPEMPKFSERKSYALLSRDQIDSNLSGYLESRGIQELPNEDTWCTGLRCS